MLKRYTPRNLRNFGPNAVFVASNARPVDTSPVAVKYDRMVVCIVFDRTNGKILDVEFNTILDTSTDFMADLLIGKSVYTDANECIRLACEYYNSVNQKALTVALKNAFSKVTEFIPPPESLSTV